MLLHAMSVEGLRIMDDQVFFKSVLPVHEEQCVEDTSLALPREEHLICPRSGVHSNGRSSLRVQQQVQLTLARRQGKRSQSNGSIHLQKSSFQSPDARNGALPNMKVHFSSGSQTQVNGGVVFSSSERSLSSGHLLRRPSRRVEVSPSPSPELPRANMWRFATHTLPGPALPRRTGATTAVAPERSYGSPADPRRRYAFSEVPRGSRLPASTYDAHNLTSTLVRGGYDGAAHAALHHGQYDQSFSQTLGSHRVFSDGTLQHACSPAGSPPTRRHHAATAAAIRRASSTSARRQAAAYGTGPGGIGGQRDEALAWLAQMRSQAGDGQGPRSYPPSVVSMEVDMSARMMEDQQVHSQEATLLRSEVKAPELTLERAVNLLTAEDEDVLVSAASFIQKQCFNSAEAKKMVFYLHGIPKLLSVLQGDSEEGQRAAAGALRNTIFQSNENKMEVKDHGGVATVLAALKSNRDLDTRRQLTGVLWNLSSHDLLKELLCRQALPVLTTSVLVPCSGISEGENPKDDLLADPDVFHNTTGCLRNVSSAGPDGRKAMRECDNLIDCLVYYIRRTIADYKPDDKSIENCVCILHNLSYQIEAELPQKYLTDLGQSRLSLMAPRTKNTGCFSQRSAKITESVERQLPLLEERSNPCGLEWLWSPITVRMYLSLMACSGRHCTQEAAVGALQNITAGNGRVTEAIAHTIVQRENGLQQVKRMLEQGESDVRRMAVSLLKNLSRYRELHADIVKQVLPDVVGMLPNSDTGTELPTEVTVSLLHVLINLSQNHTLNVRAIVNHAALPKIIKISTKDSGYGPTRAGQAACILLHSMWSHAELHGAYRKAGYRKSDFINSRSTKAVNSSRD